MEASRKISRNNGEVGCGSTQLVAIARQYRKLQMSTYIMEIESTDEYKKPKFHLSYNDEGCGNEGKTDVVKDFCVERVV